MNGALIQSMIVGIVAILSALIGGILPNWIQHKIKTNEIKREKLEELYLNIENWYNSAFNLLCIQFKLVFDGYMDWNGYLDKVINEERKGDHKKSNIILHLYFKELENDFILLHEAVLDLNSHIDNDIKKLYLAGEDICILRKAHSEKIIHANKCMDVLKSHMHKIAKSLG